MKQTSEQYFNNLPEEPETYACSGFYCPPTPIPQGYYACSGFYCPPTPIPQGYYECPHCDGTGDLGGEYDFDEDGEEIYKEETCDTCKGKGYITLKELNKWNKKHPKICYVSAYMET